MSLAPYKRGTPPSRDLQISKATPPTSTKVTVRGFLEFGSAKTYQKAFSLSQQRREVFFKNDVLFRDLEGWNEEGCSFSIPRVVYKDVSSRTASSTVSLLEYLAQFALCGQFLVWITEVEEDVPVTDKVSPLPKPKATSASRGKKAEPPKPKPSVTTPFVIEPENEKGAVFTYLEGRRLTKAGELEQAVEQFSTAIDKFAGHAMAYEGRGVAQMRLGNSEDAILDFTRSIELCAMHAEAYVGRATILMVQKNYERALADLDVSLLHAVPHQPVYWDTRRLRAECNLKLGNIESSVKESSDFLKRPYAETDLNYANLGRAWRTYGNSLSALNRFTEAMEAFDMSQKFAASQAAQERAHTLFCRSMARKRAGLADYKSDLEMAAQLGSKKAAQMMQ